MSIRVRDVDDDDRWNGLLERTSAATPFHLAESLRVLAAHSNSDVHRLVGYKGEEPVGLFPVFTTSRGPFKCVYSPPPGLKVTYLGPLTLVDPSLKQRRREVRNARFVDAVLEWLEDEHAPRYVSLVTNPGFDDIRPFLWHGFEASPRHTYCVHLSRGPDDLLAAFSSDARKNVTAEYDTDYEISEEGVDAIGPIVEQVTDRFAEQGKTFPVDAELVVDLYESLPEDVVRPYVCRVGDEFVGGTINLELGPTSISWFGGARTTNDLPVNDLLDWTYCRRAIDRDVASYDFAGADNRRISRYKAKFAPTLTPYYSVRRGTWSVNAAAKIYERVT